MQALLDNPISLSIIILFGSYLLLVYPVALIIGLIFKTVQQGNPFQGGYIAWLCPVGIHLFAALAGLVIAIYGAAFSSGPFSMLVTYTRAWQVFSIAWFVIALTLDIFVFSGLWGNKKKLKY